ncbi:hypothetical protein ACS0TY_013558 [Phlomoides rotata]
MLALNSASTPSKSSSLVFNRRSAAEASSPPAAKRASQTMLVDEIWHAAGDKVHILFCLPDPVKFKEKTYSRDQIDEMRMEWGECIQREI